MQSAGSQWRSERNKNEGEHIIQGYPNETQLYVQIVILQRKIDNQIGFQWKAKYIGRIPDMVDTVD